jgi:hypothetical protein
MRRRGSKRGASSVEPDNSRPRKLARLQEIVRGKVLSDPEVVAMRERLATTQQRARTMEWQAIGAGTIGIAGMLLGAMVAEVPEFQTAGGAVMVSGARVALDIAEVMTLEAEA